MAFIALQQVKLTLTCPLAKPHALTYEVAGGPRPPSKVAGIRAQLGPSHAHMGPFPLS
jgi:hypothetical protein